MKFTINNNLRLLTCPLLLAGAVCCSSGNDGDTPAPGPGPDPSPVTGDVLAYVTSADGNRLFTEEGLDYSKVSMSPYRVTIDPSTTYQTVDGFGPAITGATCYNLLQMSQADRTAILRKCFDPETGAGFSFIRVHIGGSDFSMDEYTCCDREGIEFFAIPAVEKDGIFPVLKEILEIKPPSQADGIIFFFTGFALPSCFQADCRFIHIFVYDGIILFCSCISGVIDDSCNTGFVPYGSLLRIGDLAVGQLVRNCLQGSSVQIRIENLSDNFRFFS